MSEPEELVVVAEYPESTEAELARQMLEDAGIKAMLEDQNAGDMVPIMAVPVKLCVLESQAEQAIKVLESIEKGPGHRARYQDGDVGLDEDDDPHQPGQELGLPGGIDPVPGLQEPYEPTNSAG